MASAAEVRKYFGIFFRVDAFEQQADRLAVDAAALNQRGGALEAFDAALVLGFAGEPRDDVAGEDDHGRAFEGLHDGKRLAEFGKKGVAGGGISEAVAEARGGVKRDAEALAGGVGAGELGRGPVAVFADELDVAVAGGGDFLKALFERQIAEDSPEHDGERGMRRRREICLGRGPERRENLRRLQRRLLATE